MTTVTARKVTITVETLGAAFACCGVLSTPRGRRIVSTDAYPYGQRATAYEAAERLATDLGYTVVESK